MSFYLLVFLAYAIGSIPFGLVLARFFADMDIRQFGSGNIGATNVNRVLGRKLGAATLLCDMAKGLIPVLIARALYGDIVSATQVGMAAFLGHCFPIYMRFKGGKGVATAFGVLIGLSLTTALIGLGIWLLVVRISKISSLGALISSVCIPIIGFIFLRDWRVGILLVVMMSIVIVRHRDNIRRLSEGAES